MIVHNLFYNFRLPRLQMETEESILVGFASHFLVYVGIRL